jgi:hypothetical protein
VVVQATPSGGGPAGQGSAVTVVPQTFPIDPNAARTLQAEVNAGRQPWRLDPVEVARATVASVGIDSSGVAYSQVATSEEPGTGRRRSTVRVGTGPGSFEVDLVQPVTQGPTGIWMATGIRRG